MQTHWLKKEGKWIEKMMEGGAQCVESVCEDAMNEMQSDMRRWI